MQFLLQRSTVVRLDSYLGRQHSGAIRICAIKLSKLYGSYAVNPARKRGMSLANRANFTNCHTKMDR